MAKDKNTLKSIVYTTIFNFVNYWKMFKKYIPVGFL